MGQARLTEANVSEPWPAFGPNVNGLKSASRLFFVQAVDHDYQQDVPTLRESVVAEKGSRGKTNSKPGQDH